MESREYQLMDEAEQSMWWYRALHARLLRALAPVSGRVLDAGCGTGGFLAVLRRSRPELAGIGVEYEAMASQRAAEKAKAPVVQGSVNELPFATASFDAVVTADVLCHAGVNPQQALADILRVLRPGGRLVINMPAYAWLASAHDRRVQNAHRVSRAELVSWLQDAGFAQIEARYWNGLLLPVMIVTRKILARDDAASDVSTFPPWLNASLHAITALEHWLRLPLPFGSSVIATAIKPAMETI